MLLVTVVDGEITDRATAASVRLIDADPDLARHLDGARFGEAKAALVAKVVTIEPGPWRPPDPDEALRSGYGWLVLDGALLRDATVGRTQFAELTGPGDVLRPWEEEPGLGARAGAQPEAAWTALERTRLAVLDKRVAAVASKWPAVGAAIVDRTLRRSRSLALQVAMCHLRRVRERLLLLFWMLAERWGRVRPDGVIVPLPVTHKILARVVGAHRPSVTLALQRLEAEGRLTREDSGWLLQGESPRELAQMYANVL